MKKFRKEKGITLVALIITIVILLILAAVAIAAIQNENILGHANNAATKYNQSVKNEQGLLSYFEGYLEYGGISQEDYEQIELVKRYMLGANKTGKNMLEILDVNEEGNPTGLFVNDETTDIDESTLYTFVNVGYNENRTKGFLYAKYNNRAYRIVLDLVTFMTEDVRLVYSPQGREGTPVAYDSNLDGTPEEWVIITDRNGKVEIVSKDVAKDKDGNALKLTLGSGDTSVTVTSDLDDDGTIADEEDIAIASYNNAITRINNYCDEVVTATNNSGVRSVGGTNNSAPAYHSTNYDEWSPVTIDVASGDIQYEEDLVKLSYFGIVATDENYWLASREVNVNDGGNVYFVVRSVSGGMVTYPILWGVYSDMAICYGVDHSCAVRPVVINPSGI